MNAGGFRVGVNLSPLDFPSINALGRPAHLTQVEPPLVIEGKLKLSITNKFLLTDMNENKEYEILSAQSIYEIPTNIINTTEDIYAFYKDATLLLISAYRYVQTQRPLPDIPLSVLPIGHYTSEIERILNLLNSQN